MLPTLELLKKKSSDDTVDMYTFLLPGRLPLICFSHRDVEVFHIGMYSSLHCNEARLLQS